MAGKAEVRARLTFSESAKYIAGSFFKGFCDANAWQHVFFALYVSPAVRKALIKCFILNGVVIVGLTLLVNQLITPYLSKLVHYLLEKVPEGVVSYTGFLYSHADSILHLAINSAYNILWLYPLYALSFLLNAMWYRDIAQKVLVTMAQSGTPVVGQSRLAVYKRQVLKVFKHYFASSVL